MISTEPAAALVEPAAAGEVKLELVLLLLLGELKCVKMGEEELEEP